MHPNQKNLFKKVRNALKGEAYKKCKSLKLCCREFKFSDTGLRSCVGKIDGAEEILTYFRQKYDERALKEVEHHRSTNPVPSPRGGYEAFAYAIVNKCPASIAQKKMGVTEEEYSWLMFKCVQFGFLNDPDLVCREPIDWNCWNPLKHLPPT